VRLRGEFEHEPQQQDEGQHEPEDRDDRAPDRVLVARRSGTKGPPPNVPLNFRLLGNPGTGK
jgi:hypothetical protein